MANVPYDDGVATVAPDARPPEDGQHIEARPEMFGGAIAQATQQAGQGLVKASQFFGQVSADDVSNGVQKKIDAILHGDPNVMVDGPDGTKIPQPGFLATRGRDTLNQWQGVQKQVDDVIKEARGGLLTLESQQQFDRFSQRYRSYALGQIGTHADSQMNTYGREVNQSASQIALTHISNNALNNDQFTHGLEDLKRAYVQDAQLQGAGPDGAKAAVQRATQDAWRQRIEVIGTKDFAGAAKMADEHQAELGTLYAPLANQFRAKAAQAEGSASAGTAWNQSVRPAQASLPFFAQPAPGANGRGAINAPYKAPLDQPVAPGHVAPMDHYAYLKSQGATDNEALMLTGAAASESSLNPATTHDDGAGYGMYGHNTGRIDMHGMTWQQQASAALNELRSRPEAAMVNAARTPEQLAIAQMHFEQPRGYTRSNPMGGENYSGRYNTLAYFAKMTNGAISPSIGGGVPAGIVGGVGAPPGGQMRVMPPELEGPQITGGGPPAQGAPEPYAAPAAPAFAPPPPPQASPSLEEREAMIEEHAANVLRSMPQGLTAEAQNAYRAEVNSRMAAEKLGLHAEELREKDTHNKVLSEYQERMDRHDYGSRTGKGSIFDDVNADPRLKGSRGEAYKDIIRENIQKRTGSHDSNDYGPAYMQAFNGIVAPYGDPSKITDPIQLMKMENEGKITALGSQKLQQELTAATKNETAGLAQAKAAALMGAKSQISYDQEMSAAGIKRLDPTGEKRFSGFAVAFNQAFDKWTKDGKDPYAFLTDDNVNKIMQPFVRNKAQMAYDRMVSDATAMGGEPKEAKPITPPPGIDPKAWQEVAAAPPIAPNGTPLDRGGWQSVLKTLTTGIAVNGAKIEDPIKSFNVAFGPMGAPDGAQLYERLTGKKPAAPGSAQEGGKFPGEIEQNLKLDRPLSIYEKQEIEARRRRGETWDAIKNWFWETQPAGSRGNPFTGKHE